MVVVGRVLATTALGVTLALPSAALAATEADTAASARSGTAMASGLANPRFLVVDGDGTLYVSEAGAFREEGPASAEVLAKRGTSGRVTKIDAAGTQSVVASGLLEGDPAGLAIKDGTLYLAMGGLGPATASAPAQELDGSVVRIDAASGRVEKVSDILAYEKEHNPDGLGVDTNLFGMALGADGKLYVADAGGNALYRVDPATGQRELVATFAGLPAQEPNPRRDGKSERDPVPTGVAVAPDGSVYVGLLGAEPVPGGTKVVRVASDGSVRDAATGLTFVGDVTVGPDGNLYVTEIASGIDTSKEEPVPLPGRVLRVLADGTKQVVADGLAFPLGTAFNRDGDMYVAVNAISPSDGQVLKFARVATSVGVSTQASNDAAAPVALQRSATASLPGNSGGAYHYYVVARPAGGPMTISLDFGPFEATDSHRVGLNVYQGADLLGSVHGTATGLGDSVDNSRPAVTINPTEGAPLLIQMYNYGASGVTYTLAAS